MAAAAILKMPTQPRAFEGQRAKVMMAPLEKPLGTLLALLAVRASLSSQQ
jgi:hypothetical protein